MSEPILKLISWPFHNGLPGVSMGAGPAVLGGDARLRGDLAALGWRVEAETIPAADERRPEIARVFELLRRLSDRVSAAVAAGEFPLVLAGGCNSAIGTLAGAAAGAGVDRAGVVWFDAHADFDTTEENVSGFLDVMGVSMLTGGSWNALCATVPGFRVVPERRVVLAGARDLEPYQRAAVERSRLRSVPGAISAADLERELSELGADSDGTYLHLDLDVVDAGEVVANEYAAAGGPAVEDMGAHVERVFASTGVRAAALTAWDPAYDEGGRARDAAGRLVVEIARGALAQR